MAVYCIDAGSLRPSRDRASQIRENTAALAALKRHLGHPYNNHLGADVARSYLDLSLSTREEGKRGKRLNTGTARPLLSPQWQMAAY